MPVLANAQYEALAQQLARGLPTNQAGEAAGFAKNSGHVYDLAKNPEILTRTVEIEVENAIALRVALPAVTARLLAIADTAGAMSSAAGLAVARAALMDAARLNGVAAPRGPDGAPAVMTVYADEPLSEDEWLRLYAPPNP
jgi:hypothetical protein